jgi:hypothetical protein
MGPRRQNCLCTRNKNPRGSMGGKKKLCSAILASPPSLAKPHEDKSLASLGDPQTKKRMTEILSLRCRLNHCFLLRSIIFFHSRSSCPAHFLVPCVAYANAICLRCQFLYDLSHRSRMGKISVPNLDPSLVHKPIRLHPAGGGEPLSQVFRASRMLVIEMPCFVLNSDIVRKDYRRIMFDIASLIDLAPSKPGFTYACTTWKWTSKPARRRLKLLLRIHIYVLIFALD